MFEACHPEVLARDWLPPVATGREVEVAEVVRRLDPPAPRAPPPWVVAVTGARGTGTSTVARRAARTVADLVRAGTGAGVPQVLPIRTAGLRGTHGVACALLRYLDGGFDGRGFSVIEIIAGFLRRLRRESRPAVLILDDIGLGGPDLGPVLRALGNPDRFLPEGESGIPPTWTILAGTPEGVGAAESSTGGGYSIGRPVGLSPYSDRVLGAIVRDRAERALGRPVAPTLVARVVSKAVEEGASAGFAFDLLRRELTGGGRAGRARLPFGLYSPPVSVEPHVVRAIESAVQGREARLGEVRRWEAELAQSEGRRPCRRPRCGGGSSASSRRDISGAISGREGWGGLVRWSEFSLPWTSGSRRPFGRILVEPAGRGLLPGGTRRGFRGRGPLRGW